MSNNKGISLPGMNVTVPAMSEKDIADLRFALKLGVDLIALSFVRSPADVDLVHSVMDEMGVARKPVIAKLEKPEAVANLEAIVLAFDGVMVARGDLGVELPLSRCRWSRSGRSCGSGECQAGHRRHPDARLDDRALPADPRRGVRRGERGLGRRRRGHALGETSVGKYPFIAVKTMARIIQAVEDESVSAPALTHIPQTRRGVISFAARDIAERMDAKAIIAFTYTGDTLHRIARLHTPLPLLAFTNCRRLRIGAGLVLGHADVPGAGGADHRRDDGPGGQGMLDRSPGSPTATW